MKTSLELGVSALFSLDRLYKATSAYYFFQETGHLLGGNMTPNSVEIDNMRKELLSALLDVRQTYYPESAK